MKQLQVIGLGLGPQDITPHMAQLIEQAEVLAGGRRLLDWLPEHRAIRLELKGGLEAWLEKVAEMAKDKRVVVLASGDPGFFGIAKTMAERLGPENVSVVPNLSAMQAACARLNLPWGNASHVSLHADGENSWPRLWQAMAQSELVSIYTRPGAGPAEIGAELWQRGQENWRMHVLENLGAGGERISCHTPGEAAGLSFSSLSVVLLERTSSAPAPCLGSPEEDYKHENKLITKAEVRAVALAKLELGPGMILWDLGAGSGSLSIEASLLIPGGRIVALEQNPRRMEMIQANRAKWGVAMLEVVQGQAPAALPGLPDPHRVFIGGGGRDLAAIIQASAKRLKPGGVIVASAVLLDSVQAAGKAMRDAGLRVDQTLIQVSRSSDVVGNTMMKALNPVWLIRGRVSVGDGVDE